MGGAPSAVVVKLLLKIAAEAAPTTDQSSNESFLELFNGGDKT